MAIVRANALIERPADPAKIASRRPQVMWKPLLLAAGISLPIAHAAAAGPLGTARHPVASEVSHGVQLARYRAHRRYVPRRHVYVVRRPRYPSGYVAAPVPYAAPTYLAAPGLVVPRPVYGDRGDPLHRYYTPGLAPNVGNPSVSPSYQNPAVDDGLLFPGQNRD
jgi:hypothetical protein